MSVINHTLRHHLHRDAIGENWRKLQIYFHNGDHYWQLSSQAGSQLPGQLGMYPIDFSVQLARGHYSQFDAAGIPVRWDRNGVLVHNYTRMCGFALAHWNLYLRLKDPNHLAPLIETADYIVRTADCSKAGVSLRAEVSGAGHVGELSSMSQGQAISVLCRAWQATGNRKYLDTALGCLKPFTVPSDSGGVIDHISALNLPWYEEYPGKARNHVLNGMIFAMWGLRDLASSFSCSQAQELWQTGVDSVARALPLFDCGYWSWYYVSDTNRPYIASMMYHGLHVALLAALFKQTQREEFGWWSDRFAGYSAKPSCRFRAAAQMAQAKISWLRHPPIVLDPVSAGTRTYP